MATKPEQPVVTVYARTLLQMMERTEEIAAQNPGQRLKVIVVCDGKCNRHMGDAEPHIVICGEFRCVKCFSSIVRCQTLRFGVPENPSNEDINGLLEPVANPLIPNLWKPKTIPAFLCMYFGDPPCK